MWQLEKKLNKHLVVQWFFVFLIVACLPGCSQQTPPPSVFTEHNTPLSPSLWQQGKLLNGTMPNEKFIALFWASWCPTCIAEHPYVLKLSQQNIPIVGILYRDESSDAQQTLQQLGNPFIALVDDPQYSLSQHLQTTSTPTAHFIDSNHNLRATIIGGLNKHRWEKQGLQNKFAQLP